jgi:hypothetical protein
LRARGSLHIDKGWQEEGITAEVTTLVMPHRHGADRGETVAKVGLAERSMADVCDPESAAGQLQGPFIGHGTEDEMGMVAVGRDEVPATRFQGGVDPLDGLLSRWEICPDDHVDVANLSHDWSS